MINLNFDHLLGGWPSIYHTLTAQTGEQTLLLFKLLKNFLYLIIPGIASFAVLVSAFIWGVFWKSDWLSKNNWQLSSFVLYKLTIAKNKSFIFRKQFAERTNKENICQNGFWWHIFVKYPPFLQSTGFLKDFRDILTWIWI